MRLIRSYYNLRYVAGVVYVRRSASGRGWHLKAHGLKIDFEKCLLLRAFLGDDEVRVSLDRERLAKPKQVLWTVKNGMPATEWVEDVWAVV
jgi:hypothetical protein